MCAQIRIEKLAGSPNVKEIFLQLIAVILTLIAGFQVFAATQWFGVGQFCTIVELIVLVVLLLKSGVYKPKVWIARKEDVFSTYGKNTDLSTLRCNIMEGWK